MSPEHKVDNVIPKNFIRDGCSGCLVDWIPNLTVASDSVTITVNEALQKPSRYWVFFESGEAKPVHNRESPSPTTVEVLRFYWTNRRSHIYAP